MSTNVVLFDARHFRHPLDISSVSLSLSLSCFLKRFFKLEPKAKDIFRFTKEDIDFHDEQFYKSNPKLLHHAKYFIQMIDKSLALLGPDIELLTSILTELGSKHAKFGVTSNMYVSMGQALLSTVEELSEPETFQDHVKQAWHEVYSAFSYDMIRGGVTAKMTTTTSN